MICLIVSFDLYTTTAILLICLSVFVIIITFFGCCGAARDNRCMLWTVSRNENQSTCLFKLIIKFFQMLLVFHPGPGDPDRNGSGHLFRPVWQRWCLEAALPTVTRDLQPRRFKRTGKSTCWRMGWLPVRREFRGKLGCEGLPERQTVVLIHLTDFWHWTGESKISFFCFYS